MAKTLQEKFEKEILPKLMKQMNTSNRFEVPRIEKVTVNIGLGRVAKDAKTIDVAEETLRRITGQRPVKTRAKKSISNFKIRQGMMIGMKVTLRGKRMWDFLGKMINITIPRIRDFRGLSEDMVDRSGNLSIGFKEHVVFPEVALADISATHGLQVIITTTADTKEEGLALFSALGIPFKKQE